MSNLPSNGIPPEDVVLRPEGLTEEERLKVFSAYQTYLSTQHNNFMGYQTNQDLREQQVLSPFLKLHVNNIGDPFASGGFMLNSKQMEGAVLDYFAKLWHAKSPHNPDDGDSYWGYVLSMGSTEGNMYGLWQARDYLQGKTLYREPPATFAASARNTRRRGPTNVPLLYKSGCGRFRTKVGTEDSSRKPIAFFSEDTHYSITKICRVLELPTFYDVGTEKYSSECPLGDEWPQTVPSTEDGTIDIPSLLKLVEFFARKGHPPIVVFNMGSTFKCAYDPVEEAGTKLVEMLRKYGLDERRIEYEDGKFDIRTGYWIHVDAALGGPYVPLLHAAYEKKLYTGPEVPKFDFALPFVHSINTSGHKWPGVPWPCGLFMTKVKYQIKPPSDPAYISSPDTTFAGSRNGFSAIILWDFYARLSIEHLTNTVIAKEKLAGYAFQKLTELSKILGPKYGRPDDTDFLWVGRSPAAMTVRFRQPVKNLVSKYSLSCESINVDRDGTPYQQDYAHIYIMYHISEAMIDALLADFAKDGAFDPASSEIPIEIVEVQQGSEFDEDVSILRSALPMYSIIASHHSGQFRAAAASSSKGSSKVVVHHDNSRGF